MGESGGESGAGAASAPRTDKVKSLRREKQTRQPRESSNDLIYAAGRTLSVPTEDMEGNLELDELIHDLRRRMQEAKKHKTQARKESILQKKARGAGLESAVDATTLDSVSSSGSQK